MGPVIDVVQRWWKQVVLVALTGPTVLPSSLQLPQTPSCAMGSGGRGRTTCLRKQDLADRYVPHAKSLQVQHRIFIQEKARGGSVKVHLERCYNAGQRAGVGKSALRNTLKMRPWLKNFFARSARESDITK